MSDQNTRECTACAGVGTITCAQGGEIVKKVCIFCVGKGKVKK